MRQSDDQGSVCEADRLRAECLDLYERGEPEAAIHIGTRRLLPLSESLAVRDDAYLEPLTRTLRHLALACYRVGRRVEAFYYAQRAFHVVSLLHDRGRPTTLSIGGAATEAAELAADIAAGHLTDPLPLSERDMVIPAAESAPKTIASMGRIGSFEWACRIRVASTRLRLLEPTSLELVDHESRAMIALAGLALERGDGAFVTAEIRDALEVWTERLDRHRARYWSSRLHWAWLAAAELLAALGRPDAASALRRAVEEAASWNGDGPFPRTFDPHPHYRAALAALG